MYYVIYERQTYRTLTYVVLETISGLSFELYDNELKTLIKRVGVANFSIIDGEIIELDWSHIEDYEKRHEQNKSIYVGMHNNLYQIILTSIPTVSISINQRNFVSCVSKDELLNCEIKRHFGQKSSICIHEECKYLDDTTFDEHIQTEYKKYIVKTRLMGLDNNFIFNTIGHEVILNKYTGTSKDVTLPSFITIIDSEAFKTGVSSIKLNNGLKIIGNCAFRGTEISSVDLPETVEIVHRNAFGGLKSKHPKLIVHNKNTIISGNSTY